MRDCGSRGRVVELQAYRLIASVWLMSTISFAEPGVSKQTKGIVGKCQAHGILPIQEVARCTQPEHQVSANRLIRVRLFFSKWHFQQS